MAHVVDLGGIVILNTERKLDYPFFLATARSGGRQPASARPQRAGASAQRAAASGNRGRGCDLCPVSLSPSLALGCISDCTVEVYVSRVANLSYVPSPVHDTAAAARPRHRQANSLLLLRATLGPALAHSVRPLPCQAVRLRLRWLALTKTRSQMSCLVGIGVRVR